MLALGCEAILCVRRLILRYSIGKIELVKKVIINLARNVESGKNIHEWENLAIEEFLQSEQTTAAPVGSISTTLAGGADNRLIGSGVT